MSDNSETYVYQNVYDVQVEAREAQCKRLCTRISKLEQRSFNLLVLLLTNLGGIIIILVELLVKGK